MTKATLLLLLSGFLVLASCRRRDLADDSSLTPEMLKGLDGTILSSMGIEPETFVPPTRTRGTTTVNVQDYGATGGNTTDDTQAFQDAIDALPGDGGTVWVPAGTYYIKTDFKDVDSNEVTGNCIRLRSNMHLKLSDFAHLKAIPTDAYAAYIVYAYHVDNVEISGGEFVGERDEHMTTVGEGGHGIEFRGCSHITVRDTKFSNFWGDGISIGTTLAEDGPKIRGNDIVIDNIISTGNRRQGLSIGPAANVQVWDSEFSNTNGTSPQCGIDIEPEPGLYTDTVLIQNNLFSNNEKHGILINNNRTSNITIKHCELVDNQQAGIADNGTDTYIAFNSLHNNVANGLAVQSNADDATVVQNSFYENNGNPARPATIQILGVSAETEKDMFISGTATNVTVYTNTYK